MWGAVAGGGTALAHSAFGPQAAMRERVGMAPSTSAMPPDYTRDASWRSRVASGYAQDIRSPLDEGACLSERWLVSQSA